MMAVQMIRDAAERQLKTESLASFKMRSISDFDLTTIIMENDDVPD